MIVIFFLLGGSSSLSSLSSTSPSNSTSFHNPIDACTLPNHILYSASYESSSSPSPSPSPSRSPLCSYRVNVINNYDLINVSMHIFIITIFQNFLHHIQQLKINKPIKRQPVSHICSTEKKNFPVHIQ